jgi:hypothetical protein
MTKREYPILLVLLALSALVGMALVIYATRYGPGVGGDATIYLTSARSLLAGSGLGWQEADGTFRLLPYTPPFYPLVLSALGLLVKDLAAGARWLNVVLFGLSVFLTGWYFFRATRRLWLSALLSAVIATSPVIVGVQVWAMSEPIFILLGFAGLLALLEYLSFPRKSTLLIAAGLCALAFLTRYLGVAFVITGSLALLVLGKGDDSRIRLRLTRHELGEVFLFGGAAVLPILIWLVIDFSMTGTIASRSGQPAAAYWQRFLEMCPALQRIYLFWLLPDSVAARLPGILQAAAWLVPMALLAALVWMLAKRAAVSETRAQPAALRLVWLFGLFVLVYLVTLAVVQVFTYPPITLASRMLSPVHLAVWVLLLALLHLALNLLWRNSRLAVGLVYLACLGLLATYGLRSALISRDYHAAGIGYTSTAWRDSTAVHLAGELPPEVPLISNETTALMFLAGRPAYALQEIYQDHPQDTFTVYGAGDDPSQRAFREQGGALVLFKEHLEEDFAMYGDQVDERLLALTRGLYVYYEGDDGAIYFLKKPNFVSLDKP